MSYEHNEDQKKIATEQETKEKMVKGSAWLTAGNFISRFLGAAYIIPWYAWMGDNAKVANSLFGKGYNVYALFLMISTAGIPAAIAKQVSHYNSLNEYQVSKRLFKRAMALMGMLGIVSALFMFFASPILADGDKELIPVMRSLSAAILIFPCMSVLRGFFQGYHNMMPFAVSQIIEQVVRVFYMLLTAFIIMKVSNGSYVSAVVQSTFAAFIGMLVAFFALLWYYKKQKITFNYLEKHSNNAMQPSSNEMFKEIIVQALPFIVVGSGITLFKLVDQYTFERFMRGLTDYSDKQLSELFSVFSVNPDKLVMLVIAIATAMATASLPLITEAFSQKNTKGLSRLISDNIQLFFFIMMPATIGMLVLAYPLNTLFYAPDVLGSSVLIEASLSGLFMGYFMLVSTTLQGIYEDKSAMLYLGYGLFVKVLCQFPAVRLFEVYGPLIASIIGFAVTSYLTTRKIYQITRFNWSLTARRTLLIFILTMMMWLVTFIVRWGVCLLLNPSSKVHSLFIILIVAILGGAFYAYLSLKLRLVDKLLGAKIGKLRAKLHIK